MGRIGGNVGGGEKKQYKQIIYIWQKIIFNANPPFLQQSMMLFNHSCVFLYLSSTTKINKNLKTAVNLLLLEFNIKQTDIKEAEG